MADTKITALTALTAADPANDVIPIVDVSDTTMAASGTTKKISVNNILGASGTANLASATITGDLTVDTSTLKVDSTNNRVGIGTATPAAGYALDVRGILAAGNSAGTIIGGISFSSRPEIGAISNHNLGLIANNTTMHLITPAGVFDWYDGAGGTRMTLNSTGLGIGMTPVNSLDVGSTLYASVGTKIDSITQSSQIFKGTPDAVGYEFAKIVSGREASPNTYGSFLAFYTESKASGTTDTSVERARFNSTGNLAFANGKGIDFSAVTGGTGTATANVLNDYEEGTFTPVLTTDAVNFTSVAYVIQQAKYTKIGNLVTISGTIYTSAVVKGLASGNVVITGLPFAQPGGDVLGGGNCNVSEVWLADNPIEFIVSGSSVILLKRATSTGASVNLVVADVGTSTSNFVRFSGQYYV